MAKYDNFTLSEFVVSATAKKEGIDNTPSFEVVDHLNELVSIILQPLRTAYGKPLTITSGYRCEQLNTKVGGSKTSSHLLGYAADVQASEQSKFMDFAERWLKDNDIAFDQSIKESCGGVVWWHIGLKNSQGEQRRKFMRINK